MSYLAQEDLIKDSAYLDKTLELTISFCSPRATAAVSSAHAYLQLALT